MSELTDKARNLINSNVASVCQYDNVMEGLLNENDELKESKDNMVWANRELIEQLKYKQATINTLCGALDEAADELVDLSCKAILESDGEKYRVLAKQHKQG